jgi:phage protein D
VAREAGLSAQAEDTRVKLGYVLQHNQTDWEFLRQRARDLGFEVLVDDKTLIFQPHKNDGGETITLTRETRGLLEFRPRLSTIGLVGEVIVQGWNPNDKKAITGRASAGDAGTTMGGSRSGLKVADEAFGAATGTIVDRPVLSQAEADQIARGRLREMALAYITGEGMTVGRTDLKAGTVVRFDGFGERFSGLYYLTSVCHSYRPGPGYRTAFTVRRNAT